MAAATYSVYSTGRRRIPPIRLAIAVMLVLAVALPVRIWVPLGTFNSFAPVDVVLLASPYLILMCQPSKATFAFGRRNVAWALLLPVLMCVASFIWSVDRSETTRAFVLYAEAMVAYVLTVTLFHRLPSRIIANLISLFVIVVIVTALLSVARVPGFEPQVPPDLNWTAREAFILSYYSRLSHPYMGLSNNLATVLAFFPFLLAACARITGRARYRWVAAACTFAIFATLSRGVAIALALAYIFWMVWNGRRTAKGVRRTVTYVVLIAIAMGVYLQMNELVDTHLASRLSTTNVHIRIEALVKGMRSIAARPYGYGGGVSLAAVAGGTLKNSHNAYLQQLFYFGVLGGGMVVFALLALPMLVARWRLNSNKARDARNGLVFALITSLLVFVSEASFEGSVLRVSFYFSIGSGVALVLALERESRTVR